MGGMSGHHFHEGNEQTEGMGALGVYGVAAVVGRGVVRGRLSMEMLQDDM